MEVFIAIKMIDWESSRCYREINSLFMWEWTTKRRVGVIKITKYERGRPSGTQMNARKSVKRPSLISVPRRVVMTEKALHQSTANLFPNTFPSALSYHALAWHFWYCRTYYDSIFNVLNAARKKILLSNKKYFSRHGLAIDLVRLNNRSLAPGPCGSLFLLSPDHSLSSTFREIQASIFQIAISRCF